MERLGDSLRIRFTWENAESLDRYSTIDKIRDLLEKSRTSRTKFWVFRDICQLDLK